MKTRIEEAYQEYVDKISDKGRLLPHRTDLIEKSFIAGAEFMQKEVEKLKAQNESMIELLKYLSGIIEQGEDWELCKSIEIALKKIGEV